MPSRSMAASAAASNAADARAPSRPSSTRRWAPAPRPAIPAAAHSQADERDRRIFPRGRRVELPNIAEPLEPTSWRCPAGGLHPASTIDFTVAIVLAGQRKCTMQGDAKVIDYLNKGLRSELTAINQYWLHFRLLNNWGLLEMAKVWRKESIEEMNHADVHRPHPVPRRLSQHAGARSLADRPERQGNHRMRSRRRDRRPRAVPGSGDLLPRRQGLRLARPVRRA